MLQVKRVYEMPGASDGFRVLVDRLWPRGLSKESACVDLWLKEIAPSDALRAWFAHDREKWPEFERQYREELASRPELLHQLLERMRREQVTLLFSAKDENCNNAIVLLNYLNEQSAPKRTSSRRSQTKA